MEYGGSADIFFVALYPSHQTVLRVFARIGFCLCLGSNLAAGAAQNFGQVAVGGSANVTLTYSFTGLAAATAFSLAWNRDFKAAAPTCSDAGTISCSIVITFSPFRPGLRQDVLSITNRSGQILASTPLLGTAISPLMALYPGIISTLAGSAVGGYQNSQNPSLAEFWNPQAIALDGSAKAVYVADSINGSIRKIILSSGAVSTVAGNGSDGFSGDGGLATSASLNTPTGVAVDGAGNLYIADEGNNLIRRVDALTKIITTVAGGGTTASGTDAYGDGGPATKAILYGPQSVAVDSSGNLFIADAYNQLVRMVNATTGIITVVAGGGTSTGSDGFGNGVAATSVKLNNPAGVALDSAGNLYIADAGNNLIRRVDMTTGIVTDVAGNGNWGYSGDSGSATRATLAAPQAVAVDAAGNVYVADYGNNAIRQISASTQKICTLAGRGSTGYYGDGGNPTLAFLTSPMGIAVDENGNLYIGDSGNNVVRQVSYAASPLSFPSEPVGALSPAQVVSPINVGNQTLTLSAISVASNFQQVSAGFSDCAPGTALPPGSSCDTAVSFAPIQTGAITGNLTLTTNSLNNPAAVETVNLSAIALTGTGPQISLSAAALTFAGQLVGTSSGAQSVRLTNSGGSAFAISSIWVSGAQAGDFQISTTCGSSLAAAANCAVSVIFAPTANGTRSATLFFSDSVVGSPQSVVLSGTGNGGIAALSATSLNLSGSVGLTSAAQSVSLANNGSYPLHLLSVAITGTNASQFQVSTCPSTIAAGASCSFSVTFSPVAAETVSATLNIFDDGDSSPETVTLNGTGISIISSTGLRFIPMTPCRVADTRNPNGPFGGPILSAGVARDFVLPNSSSCGIPTTAQAYSLNFTIDPPTPLGFLSVWPTGQQPPQFVSLMNSDGRIKANAAIMPAGAGGAITVYGTQSTHVIIDINGYFVPATNLAALGFYPVTPCRIADTRQGSPLAAKVPQNFSPLGSSCGIPSSAQAYSLNLTAIPIAPIGYLTTWPAGQKKPLVSTLNTGSLDVTANAAIVPAGTNGEITVYSSDPADLVVDINGYFAPATVSAALSLFNVTPCRVLDTRLSIGPFNGTIAINVAGSVCNVSMSAQAYVLNATVVPNPGFGFLSLWQDGLSWPVSSTLNASDMAITSNMAIVPTTNGSIDSRAWGQTNLILDISAYFAP